MAPRALKEPRIPGLGSVFEPRPRLPDQPADLVLQLPLDPPRPDEAHYHDRADAGPQRCSPDHHRSPLSPGAGDSFAQGRIRPVFPGVGCEVASSAALVFALELLEVTHPSAREGIQTMARGGRSQGFRTAGNLEPGRSSRGASRRRRRRNRWADPRSARRGPLAGAPTGPHVSGGLRRRSPRSRAAAGRPIRRRARRDRDSSRRLPRGVLRCGVVGARPSSWSVAVRVPTTFVLRYTLRASHLELGGVDLDLAVEDDVLPLDRADMTQQVGVEREVRRGGQP